MIPKIIHYCWFGKNPKPKNVIKCIKSWRRYCPDYEIVEWTEDSFDIAENLYCKQAYEAKKWAFATDYARLKIIYENGGIYLDTDVEIVKSLDCLLNHSCFFGRQQGTQINTGAGFGAEKGHPAVKIMLDGYENVPFINFNGEMDLLTCPHRNSEWFYKNGLEYSDIYQEICGAAIYPVEFFSPKDAWSGKLTITKNTISIHHCDASWKSKDKKKEAKKSYAKQKKEVFLHKVKHISRRFFQKVIGKKVYEKMKKLWRHK